jgi:protein SCO1/2
MAGPWLQRRRCLLAGAGALVAGATGQPLAWAGSLPDVQLVNHDGQRVRLISDVWRDRVALMSFVFTDCSSTCGVQSAMQAELQQRLHARLGKSVVLISLTLNPLADNASRLATYSKPFQPGPHWWWLTGEPAQVFKALDALGADRGDPNEHGPVWLVGPARAPARLVGLPTIAQLEAAVLAAADRRS